MTSSLLRRVFGLLNRFFMVPVFRLGLGPFMGNPLTGYIMVLRTVGRKTGRTRYAPVNYAILDGNVYCLAGFGQKTSWYHNLRARPHVEMIMPGGALAGTAEVVTDREEILRAARQVLKNAGFAALFAGVNPFRAPDDLLLEKVADTPVIRIRPTGLGSGASDAGGWFWICWLLFAAVVVWWIAQ